MNYNFESNFISQELQKSEQGLANIFKMYFKGHIIVTSVKHKSGYIWNQTKKIYEELSIEMINNDISDLLRDAVQMKIDQINAVSSEILTEKEKEKKTQPFNTIKTNIGKSKTIQNIYSYLLSKYFNKDLALKMDNNDNIIPVKGGKVIDLSTGLIRDRTHTDYFTYEKDTEYLGNAENLTKNADKFFLELACGNVEKKNYLKLVMGSAITSYTQMKCFFILYGNAGNNGKSTLMSIMQNIFNDLYVALPADLMYAENADKVDDTQFGTLIGKTIATSIEPKNKYTNDAVIKLLTGSDSISCRRRFEDAISYNPKIKIFILLNNILRIGQDEIMKKRTRVINFDAEFVPTPTKPNQYKIDAELPKKFMTVWKNEFFTYIVNCAIEFLKSDNKMLIAPACVDNEKNEYFNNMDYIGKTLQEKFEFTKNRKDKVMRSEIKSIYQQLCIEQEKPYSEKKLLEYLIKSLGEAGKTSGSDYDGNKVKGEYFHFGIKYRDTELSEDLQESNDDDLNLIIKNQAEEIKQMKALLESQAKQIEELKKNLESKTTLKDELVEDDLDELLGVFKNQILPETRRPTIKKNVIAGRKSKVVVESDNEDD
jgi:P4 family phage/plasmid primase-like protien